MATIKIDVPYFVWRDGRPRWVPSPLLRRQGWKGRDLKDKAGNWLALDEAVAAARALNEEVSARAGRRAPREAPVAVTVEALLEAYFASRDFAKLRPASQRDYRGKADALLYAPRSRSDAARGKPRTPEPFAKAPARAIGKPEVKAFYEYLCEKRSPAMARGAIMVLSAAMSWGTMSATWRLAHNPCHKLKLAQQAPRLRIATVAEIRALDAAADALGIPSIGDAVYIALFSGQRQGDVLALAEARGTNRSLADRTAAGEGIFFKQSKTGALVEVYPAPPLISRLAQADRRRRALDVVPQEIVVNERTGRAYRQHTFCHQFADVRALAVAGDETRGLAPCETLADFQFRDLRDTAVTWLAEADATIPQIASITGHTPGSIHSILKHYLVTSASMARVARDKLTRWMAEQGMAL